MAAIKTSAETIKKWQERMAGAQQAYIDGVGRVTESPMAKAATQGQKAVQNYSNAINSGSWANALNNVTLEEWRQQCKIGAAKFATGAQKGLKKYTRFANNAPPVWAAMRAAAKAAGGTPQNKFNAAIAVLLAAGRKQGGTAFG